MPLILHQHIKPEVELGTWRIEEDEAWFLERLDLVPAEQQQLQQIKGRRRLEWLAARQLVHQMSGRAKRGAFLKDEYGKPHLDGSSHHISISHSRELAAAIAAPVAAGVDIQYLVPKIGRLAHKFLHEEELTNLQEAYRIEQLHVFWGAKEALYKAYGRRALDFRTHIYIEPFDYHPQGGECKGRIVKEGFDARFQVKYFHIENYMLVYAIQLAYPNPNPQTRNQIHPELAEGNQKPDSP